MSHYQLMLMINANEHKQFSNCIALSKSRSQKKLALKHIILWTCLWDDWLGGGLDLPALSIHNWCLVLIRSGSLRLRKNSFRQAATSWTWFTPCCSTTEWASETGTIATGENQKRERKGKGRKMCYCLWWILFTELLHSLTQLYRLYTCSFP